MGDLSVFAAVSSWAALPCGVTIVNDVECFEVSAGTGGSGLADEDRLGDIGS